MVKLGWGAASLIELELALLLELPAPLKLVVIGRIVVTLPTKLTPGVYLRLDAAGVLDIDRGEVSVDASLIESRLGTYPLTGDMALRAGWKTTKTFALAAGGFHPKFQPPPGFPALRRLAIDVSASELAHVRLEAYVAVTAGVVQFGARAEVYAGIKTEIGSFTVTGTGTLDALIHLDPFAFTVGLFVHVDIAWNNAPFLHAQLDATLEGPRPWHAYGAVQFNVLFLKPRIGVDITIGEDVAPPLPLIDLRSVIEPALCTPDAWTADLPEAPLVTLRDPKPAGGVVVVHPLGRFTVRQRVLPLDTTITRFGSAIPTPDTPTRFSITSVNVGTAAVTGPPQVQDDFPVAQYVELSDDEQLSRPGFESMPSGALGSTDQHRWPTTTSGGPDVAVADIVYDVAVVDEADVTQPQAPIELEAALVASTWATGAAGHALLRSAGEGAMAGVQRPVTVVGERYVAVDVDRLPDDPALRTKASSYTRAREELGADQQLVTAGEVAT
jgi:hypothetical protein